MQNITLSNGVQMPVLGFGTFQIAPEDTAKAVAEAIEAGYRHIDTAQAYFNEKEVGEGIKLSGVAREELFITTKVWVTNAGEEAATASVERSLQKLGVDYIDLVLIHQPYGDTFGTWRALEKLQAAGKIRAIGTSNHSPMLVVNLGEFNRVMPQVNQIEINPIHQRLEVIEQLKKEGVVVEAWAPFAQGKYDLFNNPTLKAIGEKYDKTVSQVIVRWLVQKEIVVLAKSSKKERMLENLNVFDFALTNEDMAAIKALDTGEVMFDHNTVDAVRILKNYTQEA